MRVMSAKKLNKTLIFIVLIALLGLAWWAYQTLQQRPESVDEAALSAGEQLAAKGREGVLGCQTCHGAKGEGNFAAGFPRLAGLNRDYILKQLQDFARDPLQTRAHIEPIARDYERTPAIYEDLTVYSAGTRTDAIMNGIAKVLTIEEMQQLGLYYSLLPFTATPVAADVQTLERGAELALRGKPEYKMPRCTACHGPKGAGFGAHFPPLAGQPPAYLIKQINLWQSGARDNDHLSLMKNISNLLTDADKANVAAYFANLSYQVNEE